MALPTEAELLAAAIEHREARKADLIARAASLPEQQRDDLYWAWSMGWRAGFHDADSRESMTENPFGGLW